jgi:methylphosphonate synthase
MDVTPDDFTRRAGALLRSAANDLKRDDENAERDLGLEPGTFHEYVGGRRPVSWELLRRAACVWPLNERDLLPVHDDCPLGLRIVRAKESAASSRVVDRAGRPYYEYRDTAMSRIASYRPEWIRMLQVVDDDDADNPDVQWNHGHLLYQFTYFVGPVNYYHRWNGGSHCVPMRTGDSVWGLPFAPHSFTARSGEEPAYILALTYGGELVGDAQRELSVLGPATARALALDARDRDAATSGVLQSFLAAGLVTGAELAARTGLAPDRVTGIVGGTARPDRDELDRLADGLGVSARELLPPVTATRGGVTVRFARDATPWHVPSTGAPAYAVTRLADDPLHPNTSALQVDVLTDEMRPEGRLTTAQHQYVYVLGTEPARVMWVADGTTHTEVLEAGDSAYVKPDVPLTFATAGGGAPRLLLLRIGGAVSTGVRSALGAMPEGGIQRYVAEDRLWYSREGN